MVVSIVLERNPELEFQDKVDLDKLVKEAFHEFQKDESRLKEVEKQVSREKSFFFFLIVSNLQNIRNLLPFNLQNRFIECKMEYLRGREKSDLLEKLVVLFS